jgi:hypothetical protein
VRQIGCCLQENYLSPAAPGGSGDAAAEKKLYPEDVCWQETRRCTSWHPGPGALFLARQVGRAARRGRETLSLAGQGGGAAPATDPPPPSPFLAERRPRAPTGPPATGDRGSRPSGQSGQPPT